METQSLESDVKNQKVDLDELKDIAQSDALITRIIHYWHYLIIPAPEDTYIPTNGELMELYLHGVKEFHVRGIGDKGMNVINKYLQNKGLIDVPSAFLHLPNLPSRFRREKFERARIRESNIESMVYSVGIYRPNNESPLLIFGRSLDTKSELVLIPESKEIHRIDSYKRIP